MFRNTLFGISLLALSAGSALAAPAKHHAAKTPVVAQAAGDSAPAADKPAKKTAKKSKKAKADASKTEGAKEMKAAPDAK